MLWLMPFAIVQIASSADLAASPSSPPTPECSVLTTPRLCNTNDYNVALTGCNSTTIDFPNFGPCCRLQVETPRPCDNPDATESCRSMILSNGLCPANDGAPCIFQKDLSLQLYLSFEVRNTSCCSTCRCYGDPHCESFDGTPDTWIICDARTPEKEKPQNCPMTKEMCLKQLDQNNRTCNWTNPTDKPWNIGLLGSPCVPNHSNNPPHMIMYEAEGFFFELLLGERSVITTVVIQDTNNTYAMSADDCFAAAYNPDPVTPWRTSPSNGEPPPTNVPTYWLPYSWSWQALDGNDILWTVTGLESEVGATVLCTRTVEVVNGRDKYGSPRLEVDLTEPLNYNNPEQRPDASGFCYTNVITTQGTTANTERINAKGDCQVPSTNLDIARILCGAGTNAAGITGCQIDFCQSPLANEKRADDVVIQCLDDIKKYGWKMTFCATFTTADSLAASCESTVACRNCLTGIEDFGFAAEVAKFTKTPSPNPSSCVSRSELPPDLPGSCTDGVRVQYYDSASAEWLTQFAIPATVCLINGYITLNQQTDAPLFSNPVRIIQCAPPIGTCLTSNCNPQIGFSASMQLAANTTEYETVWDLFTSGALVCNPEIYPTPTACLNGITTSPLCPCTNSGGRRLKQLLASKEEA